MTALDEWTFEHDGLALGDSIGVLDASGLDDLPDLDTGDSPRTGVDGMWPGQDFARSRTITLTLETVGQTDAALVDTLADMKAAFTISRTDDAVFRFRLGGDITKRVYCRCRRRSLPLDYSRITRIPRMVVQLAASDPRIYDDVEQNGSTLIGSSGTGVSWPTSWPLSWGGASSSGQVDATNDGDCAAPWTATLAGPLTNPYLVLDGQRLSFTGELASGDILTLDSLARTVLLNGTASRYEWLDVGAEWFDLAPGDNTVDFGADTGDGTLTLAWRSTWL